jgi:tetratricopeptide (TPR) repeat protein
LNRPFEAEANWRRMLAIDETMAVAHQRLIYFYAMTLQRQKMIDQIHQAISVGSEPPEAYSYLILSNVLNFSDGLTVMTRGRANNPDDPTLEVAQAIYAAKKTAENEMATFGIQTVIPGDKSLLESCLSKYPDHPEILALNIEMAMLKGDDATVLRLLGQAAPEAESDSRFWRYRGWLLEKRGQHEAAVASLERALELNPFDWPSRWLLADVYRKLNQIENGDKQAQIAAMGKDLQEKIFEQRTARDLDDELLNQVHGYLTHLKVPGIRHALGRRLSLVEVSGP